MTRLGHRIRNYLAGHRWPRVFTALSLLLTVLVWVVEPERSSAQAADPFSVEVSKITDIVSGETIQVDVRTDDGTVVFPGSASRVFTCRRMDDAYQYTVADFTNGNCVTIGGHLNEGDNSIDGDRFHRFPDNGSEHGQRGIVILRPGVGTANWRLGGVDYSLTCGPDDPCRLVYDIYTQTGSNAAVRAVRAGPELNYRPVVGIEGCEGQSPDVVTSTMPDRLQDTWLSWTRNVCQTSHTPPPTSGFFAPEGTALNTFAAGEFDLAYSAVGYRPGFDPATKRKMVPVPIGLNAVVVAVGGGYPVVDGSWPTDFPRPHSEFKLTTSDLAILFGQWEQGLVFSEQADEVLRNNPQIPGLNFLLNSNVGAGLALTGPQSTSLFASTYFDTLAPDDWKSAAGVARGVETDFNTAQPPHATGELDLKTGRPDLARIVYRELYSQGTYYVLTDLATAHALGLTIASIPDPANPDGWITPTAETLAAAVPQMQQQPDGTLLPNPNATAGYPLTYVEYAMAPAEPLVGANCTLRTGSQGVLEGWLQYLTTDGQGLLPVERGGLVPLTAGLRTTASNAIESVGSSPLSCATSPPTSPPTTQNTGGTPGSAFGPDAGSGSGSRPSSGDNGSDGDITPDTPTRPTTPETVQDALDAAEEDDVDLPGLTGIRAINDLWSPVALLLIVALSTCVTLATAGYEPPEAVRRLPGWFAAAVGEGVRRLRSGRAARKVGA